ncbi:MAG TPA: YwhD family protein [Bacillota bacterium]
MSPWEPEDDALRIVPVADEQAQSLGNLSAVIIAKDHAYVAPGALHGRSPVEQGVRWLKDASEVPDGETYWIAWVTLGRGPDGHRGYRGLTVSEMLIDRHAMVGYKHLPSHVNAMKAALAGEVDVRGLPARARTALAAELKGRGLEYWRHARPEIKQALRG